MLYLKKKKWHRISNDPILKPPTPRAREPKGPSRGKDSLQSVRISSGKPTWVGICLSVCVNSVFKQAAISWSRSSPCPGIASKVHTTHRIH